ncbi:MAG: RluA family pseudouridine synthase [Kiritimatiellae bacterium]|nr:RluA family pseudouridine synthase [Kiritimatiellia bacterium]
MSQNAASMTTFIVSKNESDQTLQAYLAKKLKLSNRGAKNLIDRKQVWINRRNVWMARHLVRTGDTIELPNDALQTAETGKAPAPVKLRILVEDDDYLVIDKPSGLLSTGTWSAEELLREQTGIPELQAVHRLDKETTGCLLFAKSIEARNAAVEVFKTHLVKKIYQAIVWGKFERASSTVTPDLDGERAISHISREIATKDASFIKIRIETGRTHQIRRHLAMIRFPILGDRQYGLKKVHDPRLQTIPRVMLHASELELPHPIQIKTILKAHSPLPADFRRCLKLFDMGK